MKKALIIFFICSFSFLNAQFDDGFIEVYQGLWANTVVEMPDTSYVFDVRRNFFHELKGIRVFRINNKGDVLDSMSVLNKFISPFPGWRGALTTIDSNHVVSFVSDIVETSPVTIRKKYFIKWQVYPTLDTLMVKQFYPDSANPRWDGLQVTKLIQLNDGNLLVAGALHQPTPWTLLGYLAKLTPNLDLIWETTIEEPDNMWRTIDDIIPHNDGTFFISGVARTYGGGPTSDKREMVAHIDSNGTILWEHIFPLYIQKPPNANWFIQGGTPYIALAQDSNVAVMYSRVLDCGPNGIWCQRLWWKGDVRFVKFDWNGNILIDNLIGPTNVEWAGASSLNSVPGGGFVFGGVISVPGWNTMVLRVSEQGDSLWWREPYFEDARREGGDIIQVQTVIPTIDNGFVGVGSATLPTYKKTASDPHQFAFAFRLDSNGCYGPNHCHETWLSVEEIHTENEEAALKVYPNPAVNEVNIELFHAPGNYEVIMRDMQGREVKRQRMEETGFDSKHLLLPIQGLPSGMYTIEIIGEERHVVKVRVE